MENALAQNMSTLSTSEILRSLAKEVRQMTNAPDEPEEKAEPKKKATTNPYSLTLCEYPDFIVSKKCRSGFKHLIVMPSTNAAFIKTEGKNGETVSELLTPELYVQFASAMPDILMPDDFWFPRLKRGTAFGNNLCKIIETEDICAMIRFKVFPRKELDDKYSLDSSGIKELKEAYLDCPKLLVEFRDDEKIRSFIIKEHVTVKRITKQFGLENARDFLRDLGISLINMDRCGALTRSMYSLQAYERQVARDLGVVDDQYNEISAIPYVQMQYATFKDYVLYSSVRMGYALNLRSFFETWRDTLSMQVQIYRKIKDKYPEDLLLLHNQLAYKKVLLADQIDKTNFDLQVEEAKLYEGTYKDFVFVAPTCRQDFLDEATAQSNCLAGYVKPFADGECLILFMRHKDAPWASYITVEIRAGRVTQAKRERNREPSQKELSILYDWVDKVNEKLRG